MTSPLPPGHPPFAKPAKGVPAWALPFGRDMCDYMAPMLCRGGPAARDAIQALAMLGLDRQCERIQLAVGDVLFHIGRDIIGPAPLGVRFSISAKVAGRAWDREIRYVRGMLSLHTSIPQTLIQGMPGRRLRDVVALPEGFLHGNPLVTEAWTWGEGCPGLTLRFQHRRTPISYDDIAHGLHAGLPKAA